jgi:hypothetical protein
MSRAIAFKIFKIFNLWFQDYSNSALLFCLPHKKVTKKVTATDKFAKISSLRAKKLNIAIIQHYNEKINQHIFLFISY